MRVIGASGFVQQRPKQCVLSAMDAGNPSASAPPTVAQRSVRLGLFGAFELTGLPFIWLITHLAPAIMSPDATGYVVQARLIATEGRTSFATASPAQFVGMHW